MNTHTSVRATAQKTSVLAVLTTLAFAVAAGSVYAALPTNTHSLDLERSSSQVASISDSGQTGLDLSSDFTVEAWVKFESLPGHNERYNVVGKSSPGGNQRAYGAGVRNVNGNYDMTIYIYDNGRTPATIATSNAINIETDVWYHLAFVKDVTNSSFYLDGVDQGSNGTLDSTIYNNSSAFVLGAERIDGTDGFDGLLDNVRVFNDVRTSDEILLDAYTENVTDSNLQGEWNLNDDYTDSSGNGNDLTAGGSPVFSTDLPYGNDTNAYAHDFERDGGIVATISDSAQTGLDLSSDFTVESWVKFESLPGHNERYNVVGKSDHSGNQRAYGAGVRNVNGDYEMTIYIYNDGLIPATIATSDALSITAGTWYHLGFVKDGTGSSFYLDGVDQGSNGSLDATIHNNSSAFVVGGERVDGTDGFDGLLDNVRVFDEARAQHEVLQGAYTKNISASSLQGEWNFEGDYTDSSGNGNTLLPSTLVTDTP